LQAHGQLHLSLGHAFIFFSLNTTQAFLFSTMVDLTTNVDSELELDEDEEDEDDELDEELEEEDDEELELEEAPAEESAGSGSGERLLNLCDP